MPAKKKAEGVVSPESVKHLQAILKDPKIIDLLSNKIKWRELNAICGSCCILLGGGRF